MKHLILLSAVFFLFVIVSCNNSGNNTSTSADSTKATSQSKTTLNATKQYVTLTDGTVKENSVKVTINYNDKEISVSFSDSAVKNFTIPVVSLEKKVEGTLLKVRDNKYFEVFISSGAQPQVTFTSDRGMGNMTFM